MNRPAEELYDLAQDPWELKNLASNPLHAETKVRLRRELDLWMQQQGDRGMDAELDVHPHKSMRGADKNNVPNNPMQATPNGAPDG